MDLPLSRTPEPEPDINALRWSLRQTWKDLDGVKDQIRAVTEEIDKACTLLRCLQDREKELLDNARKTAPLLSPFQHFPPDVLVEIAGAMLLYDNYHSSMRRNIWPLTHVCKAWRSITLSVPHLWSSFSIDIDHSTPRIPDLDLVSTVLERSKNHPLSFRVYAEMEYRDDDEEEDEEEAETKPAFQIMTLLAQHSARWKRVELINAIPLDSLLGIYEHLPLLESLTLRLQTFWVTPEQQRIFAVAPRLKSLSYEDENLNPTFTFPVQQLCKVECLISMVKPLDMSGSRKCFPLPDCQNLLSLDLLSTDSHRDWGRTDEIVLPVLNHLRLHDTSVLRRFRLPSLVNLELDAIKISSKTVNEVRAFLESSAIENLSSFSISLCDIDTGNHLEQLLDLPAFHSLRALTVTEESVDLIILSDVPQRTLWTESLASRLTYKHPRNSQKKESRLLLPRLRSFTFKLFRSGLKGDYLLSSLREFIISRTTVVDESSRDQDQLSEHAPFIPSRLEEVYLDFSPLEAPKTLADFNHLETTIRSSSGRLGCQCRSMPGMLFGHLISGCSKPISAYESEYAE